MKHFTNYFIVALIIALFPFNAIASQHPVFLECASSEDSTKCSEQKWLFFKEDIKKLLEKEIPYHFADEIFITFKVNKKGKIEIIQESAYFSVEALKIISKKLKTLSKLLSESNREKSFLFNLELKTPTKYESFPDLQKVDKFPLVKKCYNFNDKGRRASFRYLIYLTALEMPRFKDETEIEFYFEKGNLVALKTIRQSYYINTNNNIYEIFQDLNERYTSKSSRKTSANFKMTLNFIGRIGEGNDARDFRWQKLARLVMHPDKKWFYRDLQYLSTIYAARSVKQRNAFIVEQSDKFGLQHIAAIDIGSEFIDLQAMRASLSEPEEPSTYYPPVFVGCTPNTDPLEIYRCSQEAILEYVLEEFRYPDLALEMGLQGRIEIKFLVDKEGNVRNIEIIKGTDPMMDFEAIRIMSRVPKYKRPAMRDHTFIDKTLILPFDLRLQ